MTSEPAGAEERSGAPGSPGDEERHLHPAGAVILAIRHAVSSWFIAVAIIASAGPRTGLPLVIALGVAILAYGIVEWRVTRYVVVDGGLRYRTGVVSRREVDVPAARISALDTSRGILQRIFGVVALEVQTPGGSERAEVVLPAVSVAEAERLRAALGHRGAGQSPGAPAAGEASPSAEMTGDLQPTAGQPPTSAAGGPAVFVAAAEPPPEPGETVFRATPRDLLLAGITSPSGAVIGAMLAVLYGPMQDALGDAERRSIESSAEELVRGAPWLVVVAGLLLIAGLSVLSTVFTYYGFEVRRDDRRLRVRRGLLTERTGTLPIDRVHALRIVESPLRQWLGYVAIEAEVAGWAREDDTVKTIVPFVRRAELAELLPRLVPGYRWSDAALEPPPARAARRYAVRLAWFPAAAALALAVSPLPAWAPIPAALLAVLGALVGRWQFAAAGWMVDDRQGQVFLRSRRFARETTVALIDRVQFRSVRSTPPQRRAALGTLALELSSRRTVLLRYLDAQVAARLLESLRPRTTQRPR